MFETQMWSIDRLIPYARNPRRNDEAVPKLASLIKEFGFKVPVVVRSDGEVVDGHLRLKAAQMLGLKEVPVVLADEWTEAQVKAFRIAVNKSAEWAEWDDDLLKLEFEELKDMDFNLDLTGFTELEAFEITDDIKPDKANKQEESEYEQSDDELLAAKRVIIVFKEEEEMFMRKLLHLESEEKIAVLYQAEDLAKRLEAVDE